MKKYRVLVVEDDTIFINGIELLLVLQENLEIIGTASADEQAIISEIEKTQPDVVIVSTNIAITHPQLILTLFKTYPALRVVTVSLENNRINVYDNREVTVDTVDDLVTAIIDNK